MAGHSKWANIKHRKAAQDAQRGKIFTKLIRELVTAAKLGGGDVSSNPRLRAAVDRADELVGAEDDRRHGEGARGGEGYAVKTPL